MISDEILFHYCKVVSDFFEASWIEKEWNKYLLQKSKFTSSNSIKEAVFVDYDVHPLLTHLFKWWLMVPEMNEVSIAVPNNTDSSFIICHLGRDLELLVNEISKRGNQIRDELRVPSKYDSLRYTLLIAAGYKLNGFEVEILGRSKKKIPDLFVKKSEHQFYIECKRRNQKEADRKIYSIFLHVVEKYLPQMEKNKLRKLHLEIRANLNIEDKEDEFLINLDKFWHTSENLSDKYEVTIYDQSQNGRFREMMKELGHFNGRIMFSRAPNQFIASEPIGENIISLELSFKNKKIPPAVFGELIDANKHQKGEDKLIVYYDFGDGRTEWITMISDQAYEEFDDPDISNIDAIVFSNTSTTHLERSKTYEPNFYLIGDIERLDIPGKKIDLFGLSGKAGFDSYIIPGSYNDNFQE